MTQKEEALKIAKKHFISSYPNYYVLIENLILEDESIYFFIVEQEPYLKYGKEKGLLGEGTLFIIVDKKRMEVVELNKYFDYILYGLLKEFYRVYKIDIKEAPTKEQVEAFFQPLNDYTIQRNWSFRRLMVLFKRGIKYSFNTRDIFNYLNDEKLRLGRTFENVDQTRHSFQDKYFQGLLYVLRLKR